MSQKSILEQALLQVQNLEDAVKVNAKGILESTMKQELKDLLKESMEEEEDVTTDDDVDTNPDEEETDDLSDDTDETDVDDTDGNEGDDTENDEDLDKEPDNDSDDYGNDEDSLDEEGEEDEPSIDDSDDSDDSDVMDMTGASHDEVLKVFKAMKPEDGIVVKKDGNKIEFNDGESDYIIKLDDEGEMDENWEHDMAENDNPFDKKVGNPKMRPGHSVITGKGAGSHSETFNKPSTEDHDPFDKKVGNPKMRPGHSVAIDENDEPFSKKITGKLKSEPGKSIAMDENDEPFSKKVTGKLKSEKGHSVAMDENGDPYSKKTSQPKMRPGHSVAMDETDETVYEIELDDEGKEGDQNEASRTFGNGVRGPRQKYTYQAGRHEMNEEISKLRKQNAEYKEALVLFKDKLNEVAVFNANLAHMTCLFTEQTTTKKEKLNIIKRFDSISSINESKNLFRIIETELTDKKPISEAVVEKISMTPTSSSTNVLSEAKAYENPQFKRMKDLMSKLK